MGIHMKFDPKMGIFGILVWKKGILEIFDKNIQIFVHFWFEYEYQNFENLESENQNFRICNRIYV